MMKSRRQHLMLFTACSVAWGACPTVLHAQASASPETTTPAPAAGKAAAKTHRKRAKPATALADASGSAGTAPTAGQAAGGVNGPGNFGATPGGANGAGTTVDTNANATSTGPLNSAAPSVGGADGTGNTVAIDTVQKTYQQLLLKERNVPSAVSEVGQAQIQSTGLLGSVQSLLKQTPSVNSYSPGVGQNTPELTVRGVRYTELSTTLDGIPINDLLSGGQGAFLSNNIGNPVAIGQLSSVNVYPGTAPVDVAGFGTIGGTIAYESMKPTDKPYTEVFGGVGSFDLDHYGFTENTGSIPGADGLKLLLRYDQSENAGFIDNTNSKYRDMNFSADKPYNDGTSHITLDVIYNDAKGYLPPSPTPTDLIAQYGYTYNYPKNESFFRQDNNFLTAILGDETYINEHLIIGAKAFYVGTNSKVSSQVNPNIISPTYPYQPNFQVPFFAYGPIGPTAFNTNIPFIGGSGNRFKPGVLTYDPLSVNPGADPTNVQSYAAGEAAEVSYSGTDTYGIAPKANIILPYNNITVGGLFAKETSGPGGAASDAYIGATVNDPQINGYNSFGYGGGSERTIVQGYVQDRIDLFNNHLHIEPGFAEEGVLTTTHTEDTTSSVATRNGYDLANFDRAFEPYIGVSYDLPYHLVAYASYGRSASFPQITDYSLGIAGSTNAPHSSLVHAYEAGLRYDTPRLLLNVDYFYQKTTSAVGFFANYLTDEFRYDNSGANQYRGVEMNGQYRLTPHLQVFGTGSYNDAEYLNNYAASTTPFQDQFGYAFQDTPLSSVPNWIASFGADYENGPLSLRLWDQYTGEQFTTVNLSITEANPSLAAATTTNQAYKLASFNTVNFLGSYTMPVNYHGLKSLKFALNAQNIFNTHYYQYRYLANFSYAGVYGSDNYYTSAFAGQPAAVIFDVTARF